MSAQIIYFPGAENFLKSAESEKIKKKVAEVRSRRERAAHAYFNRKSSGFFDAPDNVIEFPIKIGDGEDVISNLKDLFYQRNLELRNVVLNIKNLADRKRSLLNKRRKK